MPAHSRDALIMPTELSNDAYLIPCCTYFSVCESKHNRAVLRPYHASDGALLDELVADDLFVAPARPLGMSPYSTLPQNGIIKNKMLRRNTYPDENRPGYSWAAILLVHIVRHLANQITEKVVLQRRFLGHVFPLVAL